MSSTFAKNVNKTLQFQTYLKRKELFISDTLSGSYNKNLDFNIQSLQINEIEAQVC